MNRSLFRANATPRYFAATLFVILLRLLQPPRAVAENKIEYRYEDYNEDDGRIHIRTHSVGFEQELDSKITAKGLLVYDGISGATPTSELPALGDAGVPLANITDIRRALSLDLAIRYRKSSTLTPQFSYSQESDYTSRGISLTHTYDFNQKNTTLVLGAAHNFDSVGGGVLSEFQEKGTTDFLLGVNQLLSPETVLTVNLTFGYSDGYLNDPYRRVTFYLADSPDPIFSDPASVNPLGDNRPRHRFKQVGYISIMQSITPLNASVEGSYRPYHDDWGIWAHTVSVQWNQMIGHRVTLSPLFRFYHQSAADFYAAGFRGVSFDDYASGTRVAFQDGTFFGFEGDPLFPAPSEEAAFQIINVPARPAYYSADYRLSEFAAFTFGVSAQIKICERFTLDLAYKRYEMHGLDHVTPRSAYPSAHIFTIGCGVWF